ncbi:expressed protein [Chlorella variabilis]|uniref:Expressed protein n=1 Tax=Chlorella variabilis TaxID=554065 RepID=E1ZB36_CHLVA|nr:expressed protein [Chlorella variabilis]EFN57160.1 expressed protein [Chlorella variabilis]|eukprot:XP_005849262.1 expressed protein [Chlorella variabilis]
MAAMAAEVVHQAERALLLSDFCEAERHARQACQLAAGQADARELQDRACVVALQTLFETQRFGLAHRLLRGLFGSAASAPPNTLLLWLALALDTDSRREAERLILELLDACQPSGPAGSSNGWSRRQYLALLHLYTLEVLLRELREPAGDALGPGDAAAHQRRGAPVAAERAGAGAAGAVARRRRRRQRGGRLGEQGCDD